MKSTHLLNATILLEAHRAKQHVKQAGKFTFLRKLLTPRGPAARVAGGLDDAAAGAAPAATSAVPAATSAVPAATSAVPAATSAVPAATSAASGVADDAAKEALRLTSGKGSRLWGKPSTEQLAAGPRPGGFQNPFARRVYSTDKSIPGYAWNKTKVPLAFATGGLAYDHLANTPERMRRAGEYGAASAMQELGQGSTWDKLVRVFGLSFGSPDAIGKRIREISPGAAKAYKDLTTTGYRPGADKYEDFKKLYLGL